jgi:hypothetical protein
MPAKRNRPSHTTKGNIFDDLGFSPDDAITLKIKAKILAHCLIAFIKGNTRRPNWQRF